MKKISGVSGVLNTSFNIHGYPIVNTPEDAIWTLDNSDLDAVQIGNFLVTKKHNKYKTTIGKWVSY